MSRLAAAFGTLALAVVSFAFGLGVSLFTAGVALFADGGGPFTRLYIVGIGAAALFVLGLVAALLVPSRWRTSGIWLGVPVVPVVMFFAEVGGRPDWLQWSLLIGLFVVSFVAASLLGAWFGVRLRGRWMADPAADAAAPGPDLLGEDEASEPRV